MLAMLRCRCCGHVGHADGPGVLDRLGLVGAWGALLVGAAGAVMLGPHFTLFILPFFVPPFLGLLAVAHDRALRPPQCRQCGRYLTGAERVDAPVPNAAPGVAGRTG